MDEQKMFELSLFEQKAKNLQEQFESLEKGIIQLEDIRIGLDEFNESEGKEVLAQIGRGIFIKTEIKSSELYVDIGEGNFIKKNVLETKKTLKNQIEHLRKIQDEIKSELDKLNDELDELMK